MENMALIFSFLTVSLRRAPSTLNVPECRGRVPYIATGALTTLISLACFTSSLDLFRRPQVGLGESYVLFRS